MVDGVSLPTCARASFVAVLAAVADICMLVEGEMLRRSRIDGILLGHY